MKESTFKLIVLDILCISLLITSIYNEGLFLGIGMFIIYFVIAVVLGSLAGFIYNKISWKPEKTIK